MARELQEGHVVYIMWSKYLDRYCANQGLSLEHTLPGRLNLARKAKAQAKNSSDAKRSRKKKTGRKNVQFRVDDARDEASEEEPTA